MSIGKINKATDIVSELRAWEKIDADSVVGRAAAEIERLRKERDEARRIACENNPFGLSHRQLAKIRGWDCFDLENTNA